MHDLTAYFLTLDRPHAAEALARLRDTQQLVHPVIVVRGVRPLARAYAQSLTCPTPYCLLLDEDVLLRPGVVPMARAELIARRRAEPSLFMLSGDRFADDGEPVGGGGFKLYHTASLRRVGFPDAPHMSWAQEHAAARLGLRKLSSALVIGTRGAGTATDAYQRVLWDQLRWNAVQSFGAPRPDPFALAMRARAAGDRQTWAAALGALDGALVGRHPGSKDDRFVGPVGATVDLERLDAATAERALERHRRAWRRALVPLTARHHLVTHARRVRRIMACWPALMRSCGARMVRCTRPARGPEAP